MAGNVKEWCANEVGRPAAALHPRRRVERTELSLHRAGRAESVGAAQHVRRAAGEESRTRRGGRRRRSARVKRDPGHRRPGVRRAVRGAIGDSTTTTARRSTRVSRRRDDSPYWRKETVSFAAAYGNERVPAYLFLPKNVKPPYQTIVLFPSAYARAVPSSGSARPRSRSSSSSAAVARCCIPSTRARSSGGRRPAGPQPARATCRCSGPRISSARSTTSRRGRKSTRSKLGYYSLSMGAFFGPIPVGARAADQGGGLRGRWPAIHPPAGDAIGELLPRTSRCRCCS